MRGTEAGQLRSGVAGLEREGSLINRAKHADLELTPVIGFLGILEKLFEKFYWLVVFVFFKAERYLTSKRWHSLLKSFWSTRMSCVRLSMRRKVFIASEGSSVPLSILRRNPE
jgi:hypothetical protein